MAIEDNTKYGLTGAQIKELSTRVKLKGDKPLSGNTDPSTSTAGGVGQLYINKTAGTTFYLESISGAERAPVYNWISVGGGSGGTQADWNTTDSTADSYIKNKPMENSLAFFTAQDGASPDFGHPTDKIAPASARLSTNAERNTLKANLAYNQTPFLDSRDEVTPWLNALGFSYSGPGDFQNTYTWEGFRAYHVGGEITSTYYHCYNGSSVQTYEGSSTLVYSDVREFTSDNGTKFIVGVAADGFIIFCENMMTASRTYWEMDYDQFISVSQTNGVLRTLDQTMLPKATTTVEGITSLQTVTDTVSSSIAVGDYLKKTTVNNKPQLDIKQAFVDWEESDNTSPAYIINRPFGVTPAGATVPVNDVVGAVMSSYGTEPSELPRFGAYLPAEIFSHPASSVNYYAYEVSNSFATFLGLASGWTSLEAPFKCLGVEGSRQQGAYGSAYFPTGNKAGDELLANIQAGAQVTINYGWWYESMEQMQNVGCTDSDTVTFRSGTFENRTYYYYSFAQPKSVSTIGSGDSTYIYGFVALPVLNASGVEIGWTLAVIGAIMNEQFEFNAGFYDSIAISYVSALPSVQYLDAQVIPLDPNVFEINAQGQITLKTNP